MQPFIICRCKYEIVLSIYKRTTIFKEIVLITKNHFYFQNLLLLVHVSMIACAVYQVLISLLKAVILLGALISYVATYSWVKSQIGAVIKSTVEDTITLQYLSIVLTVGFAVALILHGRQTEATFRLDFVWKLQATGKKPFQISSHFECIAELVQWNLLCKNITLCWSCLDGL